MTKHTETYAIYCEWYREHRGCECPISEAAFNRHIRGEATVVFEPDFDIEVERREGWTYQ